MADTDPHPDDYLFARAHSAQVKAIRARRRRLKRLAHRAAQPGPAARDAIDHSGRPAVSPTQRHGAREENRAGRYLEAQGLHILARNLHCRTGEIDLVATDGTSLIFVEVRARGSRRYGGAAASVSHDKQARLRRTAQFFLPGLCARHFAGVLPPCRFDVI
ncbi:MAG TPA: YraN family protein, partial [Burkholderiaceae bacterium]|nr:YraN family protein [Burkholderiaceae bacterium]